VFQQGSVGIAGAVDGAPEYIDPRATAPRREYRGPVVEPSAMAPFGFDARGILRDGAKVQLNSVENYIAYDTLMLVEQVRRAKAAKPLKTVILGCTHFPFYADVFRRHLERLYANPVYRPFIAKQVTLVDPAVNTALELYEYFTREKMFREKPGTGSEFYISVPNVRNREVKTDAQGYLTYDYKYSRRPGTAQEFIRAVPFSRKTVPADILDRFREKIPSVYKLIVDFNRSNPKLRGMPAAERIQ
jgi:glutamate racemase